jgi:hypothetical protein
MGSEMSPRSISWIGCLAFISFAVGGCGRAHMSAHAGDGPSIIAASPATQSNEPIDINSLRPIPEFSPGSTVQCAWLSSSGYSTEARGSRHSVGLCTIRSGEAAMDVRLVSVARQGFILRSYIECDGTYIPGVRISARLINRDRSSTADLITVAVQIKIPGKPPELLSISCDDRGNALAPVP